MPRPRFFLSIGLIAASILWLGIFAARPERRIPLPAVQTVVFDPYSQEVLSSYRLFREASLSQDKQALLNLLENVRGSFLEYRILLSLAQDPGIAAKQRAAYFRAALEIRIEDPLARAETRQLQLEYAAVAEQAGQLSEAKEAYRQALPLEEAIAGLKRLEPRPLSLANIFLQARLYREAIETLDGRLVPSIEAPAYQALGEPQKALDAYERWLIEIPGSQTARYGQAWMLLALGENEAADAVFATLSGASALYGRGILARRAGDITQAVDFYRQSGEARYLWYATELLEQQGKLNEASKLYLELAQMDSNYTDDAAYRALVLAQRLDDTETAKRAYELLPSLSYFGLRQGKTPPLPTKSELPWQEPEVLKLANALVRANDLEAAVGELLFALREAKDETTAINLAEALQRLGEFRQSQRAAEAYLRAGSQDLRTWRLAYPQAYADLVRTQAGEQDLEPALIWAIMREESRFYPKAVSRSNAKGLMQFIPSTWDWVAELLKESPGEPFKPVDSIRYGAFYLRWLLDYFADDIERVVPSYNGGQGYIRRLYESAPVNENKMEFYRFIDKPETREYLQKVLLSYEIYQRLYAPDMVSVPN